MKKNVHEKYQTQFERVNGKNVSLTDVQAIYKSLLEQYKGVAEEIVDSVDRNDYVKLSLLIARRKKVQTAIEVIKSLYADELSSSQSFREPTSNGIRNIAQIIEEKGEVLLLTVSDGLEKVNQSANTFLLKALDAATKTISLSNQLNHKAGRFLVIQTATGLLKLADVFKK